MRSGFLNRKLVLLAALAIITVACSSDSQSVSRGTPSEALVSDAVTITYSDKGFSPERLEISAGHQVAFVNNSENPFWPASNIHPTHEILSALDPGTPVQPGETWAFTFERPGFWRYHDHLSPQESGMVVVANDESDAKGEALVVTLEDLQFPRPPALSPKILSDLFTSDETLRRFVSEYGPAQTVNLVADAGGRVDTPCHQRAHETGRYSYELFGASVFGSSGHECEGGAFHGAMEAFLRDRGTTSLEADLPVICGTAKVDFFKLNCIHGVGHGLMAWTSYVLPDALELCDALIEDRDQRACYSGVFMENVVGGLSGSMGHHSDYLSEDDPHYPCNAVDRRYVGPCYLYHSTRMLIMFDYDYGKTAQECARAPMAGQYDCLESFGRDLAAISLGDSLRGIQLCHENLTDRRHRTWCIQGSVQARFWETSRSEEALAMCRILSSLDEKDGCYWMIITRANELYVSDSDFEEFCVRVEYRYRAWCGR